MSTPPIPATPAEVTVHLLLLPGVPLVAIQLLSRARKAFTFGVGHVLVPPVPTPSWQL